VVRDRTIATEIEHAERATFRRGYDKTNIGSLERGEPDHFFACTNNHAMCAPYRKALLESESFLRYSAMIPQFICVLELHT
jgi:hypothetical protein